MKIVDRFPYRDEEWRLDTHFGDVRILHHQIVVWIRLSVRNAVPPEHSIPAVLDTGLNNVLVINESHLDWLRFNLNLFPWVGRTRFAGRRADRRAADVYLQPNARGTVAIGKKEPFKIEAPDGIIVFPRGNYPRLPVFGLRGLTLSNLRTVVDGRRLCVSIDSGLCCESLRG